MWIKGKNVITILTQETKFPKHKHVFEYSMLNYKQESKINQQESKRQNNFQILYNFLDYELLINHSSSTV